jgi:hypothetical protein
MVNEGTLYFCQDGSNYEVGPNQYIFLRANKEHFGYKASSGKLSYHWVHYLFNNNVSIVSNELQMNSRLNEVMNDANNCIYIML